VSSLHFSLEPNRAYLIIITIIISALVLYWSFRLTERRKSLFLILRLLIYILLIFLLFEPVRTIEEEPSQEPNIALLIDTSSSMNIKDPVTRFSLVKEFLKGPFIEELKKKYKFLFFTFASNFKRASIEEIIQLTPEGEGTDISKALQGVEEELLGERLSGILIVTDGAHNTGEDPRLVTERISVPVYSIGVGNPQKFRDIQISDVRVSDFVFKNTPADVGVKIRNYGFEGKEITVLLKKGTEIVQTKKIRMAEDGEEVSLSLSFVPRSIGSFNYTISIPFYSGELSFSNNVKDFTVEVIRDKIRILYICGQPSWEYKFLRTALKSHPSIELVSFVILRNPENVSIVPESQLSLIPFPVTEIFSKEIFNFDLLVFENFSYGRFGIIREYLENIRKFVTDMGGGFLMIGGDNSFARGGYKGTPLEEILPIEMDEAKEEILEGEFRMLLTEPAHPILRLSDDPKENSQIWTELPELDGCNRLLRPKPNAVVLGIHPLVKNRYGNLVVLAVWDKGKGRVMAMASNSTWRWSLQVRGRGGTSSHYERFWHQVVHWLVKSPQFKLVRLNTDKKIYSRGEEIPLFVRVVNRYYKPNEKARVHMEIVSPSGRKVDLGTASLKERPGEYETSYLAEDEGNYIFTATAWEGAMVIGTDTVSCKVVTPTLELENAQLNERLLKELSNMSGGRYFHIQGINIKDIIFPEAREVTPVVKKVELVWNNPYMFLLFSVLLSMEWYMRRRSGMM